MKKLLSALILYTLSVGSLYLISIEVEHSDPGERPGSDQPAPDQGPGAQPPATMGGAGESGQPPTTQEGGDSGTETGQTGDKPVETSKGSASGSEGGVAIKVSVEKPGSPEAKLGELLDNPDVTAADIQEFINNNIDSNNTLTIDFTQLDPEHFNSLINILTTSDFNLTSALNQKAFFALTDKLSATLNSLKPTDKSFSSFTDAATSLTQKFAKDTPYLFSTFALTPSQLSKIETGIGNLVKAATTNPRDNTVSVITTLIENVTTAFNNAKNDKETEVPAQNIVGTIASVVANIGKNTLVKLDTTMSTALTSALKTITTNEPGPLATYKNKKTFAYDTYTVLNDAIISAKNDKTATQDLLNFAKEIQPTDSEKLTWTVLKTIADWANGTSLIAAYKNAKTKLNISTQAARNAIKEFSETQDTLAILGLETENDLIDLVNNIPALQQKINDTYENYFLAIDLEYSAGDKLQPVSQVKPNTDAYDALANVGIQMSDLVFNTLPTKYPQLKGKLTFDSVKLQTNLLTGIKA